MNWRLRVLRRIAILLRLPQFIIVTGDGSNVSTGIAIRANNMFCIHAANRILDNSGTSRQVRRSMGLTIQKGQ